MSSRPLHKYDTTVKSLMRLWSDFEVLANGPEMAEEWVDEFSTRLETMFASGAHIGVDTGEDVQVAAFLRDVCARLLPHATVTWIEHSPWVVAGLEEELLLAPPQDDFQLLLEYSQRVKAGTMSEADFEAHKLRVLTAGQRPHASVSPALSVVPPSSSLAPSPSALGADVAPSPALSPSLSVILPPLSQAPSPLQPLAPSPAALRTSAPSPLLFSRVAPSVAGPSETVTAPPASQRPVCRAAVVAAASLVESPPARWFSVKHAHSAKLMDTSSIPGYIRFSSATIVLATRFIAPLASACRCRKLASSAHVSAVPALLSTLAPLSAHATDAAFMSLAGGVVDQVAALLFWRAELGRALSACAAADGYVCEGLTGTWLNLSNGIGDATKNDLAI
ncbi:hypothetical protein BJY52DRAFT_1197181 [Lactarius psammicola]|nr:hypothetical protein BJY52DRAFT_1197181 [Lactarius psammicola]